MVRNHTLWGTPINTARQIYILQFNETNQRLHTNLSIGRCDGVAATAMHPMLQTTPRTRLAAAAVLLVSLALTPATAAVTITSVTPSRGSLADGTRLMIKGSGFSNNVGGDLLLLCLPLPVAPAKLSVL